MRVYAHKCKGSEITCSHDPCTGSLKSWSRQETPSHYEPFNSVWEIFSPWRILYRHPLLPHYPQPLGTRVLLLENPTYMGVLYVRHHDCPVLSAFARFALTGHIFRKGKIIFRFFTPSISNKVGGVILGSGQSQRKYVTSTRFLLKCWSSLMI